MFCQKCGTKNPDNGKFCRSCGTDLGTVSGALSENKPKELVNRRGRTVSWESAFGKIFMGVAFLAVAIILGFTGRASGWWFWMLIPALGMLGSGAAQYIQLKKGEQHGSLVSPQPTQNVISSPPPSALPPTQTEYVAAESRYKTGDLVPPSVAENTTRHLELDKEGETMTLPKMEK